jgi:trk system potassium uptake protein TrkH
MNAREWFAHLALLSFRATSRWRQKALSLLAGVDSIRLLLLGYASYVILGWAVLCLPLCHQAQGLRLLDHLFTSTSAVSTTGLVTISTSDSYSWPGELVILLLIQFGGLGYMTISSFTILAVSGGLSPLRQKLSQTTLTLPAGFEIASFLKVVCWFTVAIESLGAAALYPTFAAHGAPQPVWQAIFHSVSAFCTAGFGLFNNSLEDYRHDTWLNTVVAILSYLGAIGFIVVHDAWQSLTNRKPQITLTSKVILWSTFWVSVVGTVLFALDEPTVQGLPLGERWQASLFQVMSASTTVGFNTIPISEIAPSSLYLLTVVMVIGASPSGTGGGLKSTTFSVLWAEMVSVIHRRDTTTFFGRVIPEVRRRAAVANLMFYSLTLAAGIYLLSMCDLSPLPDQIFECASALGTVGLGRGITGSLSASGKIILIVLMFVGRIGPVLFGMAFFHAAKAKSRFAEQEEDVVI